MSQSGEVASLALEARDEASARTQLESRGYTVLRVKTWRALTRRRSEHFPLVQFTHELVVLVQAGLPLVEAIDTLVEKDRSGQVRNVLLRLAQVLREGKPLSDALGQFPGIFTPLYVATVRASEKTGDLVRALSRYIAYQEGMEIVRRRIVNASIYPLLLIGVGTLVSLFLLLYVVPRFSQIYEDRAADLPLLSQFLLAWGRLVDGHAGLVVGSLTAVMLCIIWSARQPAFRIAVQGALWRLPATGERMKLYQLARFYRTVGMLLGGGLPLVTCLEMCAGLLHPALAASLASAVRSVAEGRSLSESMERHGLATAVGLRMLAVGERGGNMGEMMERIAAFHDDELTRWVERFTRLFEPLLMTAIGLVIGTIVVLMYMPIFELAGNLR